MKNKATAETQAVRPPVSLLPAGRSVSETEIAARAYEIFQARGTRPGSDLDDWLQAERELLEEVPVNNRVAGAA